MTRTAVAPNLIGAHAPRTGGQAETDAQVKPLRVLHIGGNTRVNGISTMIMEAFRRIDRRRFQFHFYNSASTKGPYEDEILRLGGTVHHGYSTCRGVARALDQMWKLRTILVEHGPFDVIHSHYYSMNGWYLLVAKVLGVPIRISHCHQSGTPRMPLTKRILVIASRYLVALAATAKLGCSETASRFLYGDQQSETLLCGIDYRRFDPANQPDGSARRAFGLDPNKKVLAFIGRLESQKNCAFLISALADLLRSRQDLTLVVLGTGSLEDAILDLIRTLDLQANVLVFTPPADVAQLLSVSDVLVLPSLWEGLPLVLLEAQAMGVPCLVSELVSQEADLGLCTFLPLDAGAWVGAVDSKLRDSPPRIARTDGKFDIENLVRRLTELYSGDTEVKHAAR